MEEELPFSPYIYIKYIYGEAQIRNPNYFKYQAFWIDDSAPVEGAPTVRIDDKPSLNIWLIVHYKRLLDDRADKIILTDSIDDQGIR